MRKKLTLFIATLLFQYLSNAQIFDWAIQAGSFTQDEGHDVAHDGNGNVYTTGTFRYPTDFDPDEDSTFILNNDASSDVFVQKLDSEGELLWAVSMGAPNQFDNGRAICTDNLGFVYVVGNFMGIADFDPDTTSTFALESAGIDDAFVVKLTSEGTLVWVKQIGGPGTDEAYDVAVDNNNNVFVTGRFQNTVDFDSGLGVYELTAVETSDDLFVCKLDSEGELLWAKSAGNNGQDYGLGLAVDPGGNVITTGYFWGVVDFDPGAGNANLTSAGAMDIFIMKLDPSGNFVWAKQMGSTGYDLGYSVVTDASGNIYSTGSFENTTDFDPNAGNQNLTSAGFQDIYIHKLNASGEYQWIQTIGGSAVEWGQSIALDGTGGVYVTGFFQGEVDFDPSASTTNLSSLGFDDVFICKFGVAGNFLWAQSFGGTDTLFGDRGQAISVDGEGTIWTTGWFFDSVDFDPGAGTFTLASNGNYDVFVQRIVQPGNAVNEQPDFSKILIYPNPCEGQFHVNFLTVQPSVILKVLQLSGKEIISKKFTGTNRITVDFELPAGMYTIECILQNGSIISEKLVVQ